VKPLRPLHPLHRAPAALLVALLAASCEVTIRRNEPPTYEPRPPFSARRVAEAAPTDPERTAIEEFLDDWHAAAGRADARAYFGALDPGAVFLGTDPSERWDKRAFEAYAEPYFSAGRGWTYRPVERHVWIVADGTLAWFDERLWNEKYGDCRGTGVVRKQDGDWYLVHYSLTLLVPNEAAEAVVDVIRMSR